MGGDDAQEDVWQLIDRLTELGFPKTNMYEYLMGCTELDKIPFYHRVRIGDDEVGYQVDIVRDASGIHQLTGYKASLLQTHPVPHGVFGGVDTLQLEGRLKAIDWKRSLEALADDPEAKQAFTEMIELLGSERPQAADISKRLQLRYWLHMPVEQALNIGQYAAQYSKEHYFSLDGRFSDITAREAYNLLAGRGVVKFRQEESEPQILYANWTVLEEGKLQAYPGFDIVSRLRELAVVEVQNDNTGPQLVLDLMRGERCRIHFLNKDNISEAAYLEADPRNQSVALYQEQEPGRKLRPHQYRKRPGKNKGRSL